MGAYWTMWRFEVRGIRQWEGEDMTRSFGRDEAVTIAVQVPDQVPLYYSAKTAEILHKYDPRPRVHFHVGLFDPASPLNTTVAQQVIRRRLVRSQEDVLDHAARSGASWTVCRKPFWILDAAWVAGPSFGQFAAHVTALTNTAEHVSLVAEFARLAVAGGTDTCLTLRSAYRRRQ